MPSIINATLVGELVDAGDAQVRETITAALHILIGVEVWDVWDTHDDAVGHAVVAQEPLQVVEDPLVVLARVATVDVGVQVLDVDVIFMDVRQETLQMAAVNTQSSLQGDVPLGWRDAAKGVNELAADSRLAAAEGDSAACGKKIEIVDHHLVEQFGWSDCSGETIGAQALGIQAIAATQRAAVEGNQRGYPLSINRQPMTGHPDNRHPIFLFTHHCSSTGMLSTLLEHSSTLSP